MIAVLVVTGIFAWFLLAGWYVWDDLGRQIERQLYEDRLDELWDDGDLADSA